jgi:hypothetical protein
VHKIFINGTWMRSGLFLFAFLVRTIQNGTASIKIQERAARRSI